MIKVLRSEPTRFGSVLSKEVVGDYTDYYKLIDCSTFDVVMTTWKGLPITLFVDDEGMMKSGNLGRVIDGYEQPLFGTVVITGGADEDGETLSFPEEITMLEAQELIGEVQYEVR